MLSLGQLSPAVKLYTSWYIVSCLQPIERVLLGTHVSFIIPRRPTNWSSPQHFNNYFLTGWVYTNNEVRESIIGWVLDLGLWGSGFEPLRTGANHMQMSSGAVWSSGVTTLLPWNGNTVSLVKLYWGSSCTMSLSKRQALVFVIGWLAYASTYLLRKPIGIVSSSLLLPVLW